MNTSSLINIGLGNYISRGKILAVLKPDSSPVRRLVKESRESGKILDATQGRKTRSIIVMDNGCIVLCSLGARSIAEKFQPKHQENDQE
ncbi:MAG: DUF370 domain-containing protein [Candidatus Eremiobacteraeota bacterium]|nr:DUF370 domain-containing protein [Candidatus Eremiobacteraeota bacterium]